MKSDNKQTDFSATNSTREEFLQQSDTTYQRITMNSKQTFNTLNIVTTAMLSALAVILSSFVHYVSGGNNSVAALVSPMHFPVFLAGILCGQWLGLICGAIAPVIGFLTSGRPSFPDRLIPMVLELATYGFLTGLFRKVFLKNPKTNKFASLLALVIAMVAGRVVSAITGAIFLAINGDMYFVSLWTKFIGNFASTWVAIIYQLVLIPAILFALQKGGILVKYLPDTPTAAKSNTGTSKEEQKTDTSESDENNVNNEKTD